MDEKTRKKLVGVRYTYNGGMAVAGGYKLVNPQFITKHGIYKTTWRELARAANNDAIIITAEETKAGGTAIYYDDVFNVSS